VRRRFRQIFWLLASALLNCRLAAQGAPKQSATSSSRVAVSAHTGIPTPDFGAFANGVYHNTGFGFTCKLPFGWVDRTKEMGEEPHADSSSDTNAPKKSILLLAVFERPPEATGDTVNSAVVVAAETASSYPGLQNPEHYFGPLTELTKSKGLTVVNEPYDYRVGGKQLVRGDFSKPLGNLTMRQSTLVMMEKGYVVSFTFIGGSEDEVDELLEGLSFGKKEMPAPHK
jgi:hypothetical protein